MVLYLVQGLMKFAFILIDACGATKHPAHDYSAGIGFDIINALFRVHSIVRSEVS